jgi:hypothetical protein
MVDPIPFLVVLLVVILLHWLWERFNSGPPPL